MTCPHGEQPPHSRFNNRIYSGSCIGPAHLLALAAFALQKAMSALPPKADMCGATVHVCYGPEADILGHGSEPDAS
jgi:hypothetical protein